MKKILFSIILFLFFCTQSQAETSVWKIQKDESVLFLGGTIHLLRPSDFPLPYQFEEAYSASDTLVFETDPGQFNNASTQQRLMSEAMYADGSTIDEHLSPETYSLLNEYCASNGISLSKFKRFKPSMIAVTIAVIELAKLGASLEGVDMFFYKLAKRDNKVIEGFETVDEQIHFMVGMGEGNEDEFITHSINDIESIKQQYEIMINAWRDGDAEKLNDLTVAEFKTKMPKLYKELLSDRNENWLPVIDTYLETPQIEFILVGAGHLVGADGIVEALRQKGYKIEKL